MELYAQALLYGIPFFTVLIFGELLWGKIKDGNVNFFSTFDTVSGISAGITNTIRDVIGISVFSVIAYPLLLEYLNIFSIETEWYVYVLTFICLDFAGYCTHRIAHKINYFWNSHVVHHSSERYTLACALRQPFIPEISVYGIFLVPAAIIGIAPEVIAIIAPIHFFAQFWYHTKFIGNLGFLEKIIVTPEQHGIHHAVNKEYMDKNFSQVFNLWDRMFGTFQEPIPGVETVYGISRPARTWNPYIIGLQHFWLMLKDAFRTKNWLDKFTIWFRPTGWRPSDVEEKYPVRNIEDVYTYSQYHNNPSMLFNTWAWLQLTLTVALILFLFANFKMINESSAYTVLLKTNGEVIGSNLAIYSLFILLNVFSFTSVMDKTKLGYITSITTTVFAFYIIYFVNNASWFNLDSIIPYGSLALLTLFIFISISSVLFVETSLSKGEHPELVTEF